MNAHSIYPAECKLHLFNTVRQLPSGSFNVGKCGRRLPFGSREVGNCGRELPDGVLEVGGCGRRLPGAFPHVGKLSREFMVISFLSFEYGREMRFDTALCAEGASGFGAGLS